MKNYLYLYPRGLLLLVIGSFIIAVAINTFIANNHLVFGGIAGIGVLGAQLSIPLGITYFLLNIPLFLISINVKGIPFTIKSIASASIVSLFLFMTEGLQCVFSENIIAALYGGVLMGVGVGLVICGNASTGGTSLAACLLKKRYNIPLGASIIMIDGSVILAGAAIFSINQALHSIILVLCLARSVEYVVENLDKILSKVNIHLFRVGVNVSFKQADQEATP